MVEGRTGRKSCVCVCVCVRDVYMCLFMCERCVHVCVCIHV